MGITLKTQRRSRAFACSSIDLITLRNTHSPPPCHYRGSPALPTCHKCARATNERSNLQDPAGVGLSCTPRTLVGKYPTSITWVDPTSNNDHWSQMDWQPAN